MQNKLCQVSYDGFSKIDQGAVVRWTKRTKAKYMKAVTWDETSFISWAKSTDATYGTYVGYQWDQSPDTNIGCAEGDCDNTGTTYRVVTGTLAGSAQRLKIDATQMTALTYFVYVPASGTYNVETNVLDFGSTALTNGNVYNYTLEAQRGAGWYPITLDLGQVDSILGAGWTPSINGAEVVSTISGTAGQMFGWSSMKPRESLRDLVCEIVKRGTCLTGFEINDTVESSDTVCGSTKAIKRAVEGSVTVKLFEDDMRLMKNGVEKTEGVGTVMQTITDYVLTSKVVNGKTYAAIDLSDFNGDKCSPFEIIVNICTDVGRGKRADKLCILDFNQDNLPPYTYTILSNDNDAGTARDGVIIMDASHIGKEVCISYPVEAQVTEYCYTDRFEDNTVTIEFVTRTNKGKTHVIEIPNAFVTESPIGLSNEDSEPDYTLSFTANKDNRGVFFCEKVYSSQN